MKIKTNITKLYFITIILCFDNLIKLSKIAKGKLYFSGNDAILATGCTCQQTCWKIIIMSIKTSQ